MDSSRKDYEFESYEKYMGTAKEVQEKIENCPNCGTKLTLTHYPDCGNLLIHETACCPDCAYDGRKLICTLN